MPPDNATENVENTEQVESTENTEQNTESNVDTSSQESTQEQSQEASSEEAPAKGIATGEEKPVVEKPIGFTDFLKERGIDTAKVAEKVKPAEEGGKKVQQVFFRDMTGIPEEDHVLFKRMSIDAFKKLRPIYLDYNKTKKEYEEIKKQKEEFESLAKGKSATSVYGHPRAYMLTETYAQKQLNSEAANQVLDHWQLQLLKVESNEKWQDLDIDPKTGNFIYGQPQEASPEAKLKIMRQINFAQNQSIRTKNDFDNYVNNYGSTYENDYNVIKSAQDKYFPGYSDPKHPTASVQKTVLEAIPASFRDSPLAGLLAMTAANNAILFGQLQQAMKEIEKLKGIKTDAEKAPPTKKNFVSGGGGNNKIDDVYKNVSMDAFKKARAESI